MPQEHTNKKTELANFARLLSYYRVFVNEEVPEGHPDRLQFEKRNEDIPDPPSNLELIALGQVAMSQVHEFVEEFKKVQLMVQDVVAKFNQSCDILEYVKNHTTQENLKTTIEKSLERWGKTRKEEGTNILPLTRGITPEENGNQPSS